VRGTNGVARITDGDGMADLLVIVLGTGAVLLMAAYADLCGRI
jgi:hypothetical protein